MTSEQKIEWLKSYRALDAKIESLTEDLQVWNARATKITATISQEPKASSSGDQLQRCVDKICELREEISREMDKLRQCRQQIEAAIQTLDDERYRDLLWYKYIEGISLLLVAERMNLSWRWVQELHKKAVEAIKIL